MDLGDMMNMASSVLSGDNGNADLTALLQGLDQDQINGVAGVISQLTGNEGSVSIANVAKQLGLNETIIQAGLSMLASNNLLDVKAEGSNTYLKILNQALPVVLKALAK